MEEQPKKEEDGIFDYYANNSDHFEDDEETFQRVLNLSKRQIVDGDSDDSISDWG